jgi:hypothetical protein
MTGDNTLPVFIESGVRRVFASALDWPGWARSGKTEELALAALADYLPRYLPVVAMAGVPGPEGVLAITERAEGVAKNADFGSLGEIAPSETRPFRAEEAARLVALLAAAWTAFDATAATAPAELRKGPRGGGRDTARIIDHVLGAEAMYARKMGLPRGAGAGDEGPDASTVLRQRIVAALRDPASLPTAPKSWPPRTAIRRMAWHALDHLWEIEDKSGGA